MSHATFPLDPSAPGVEPDGSPRTIPHAFRRVVAQQPDRLAYTDLHRSVTYREFDLTSNGVANELLARGDDRPLVVVAPLTIDSVAILHGALKAGRLVVPLDPRWPMEQWLEVTRRVGGHLAVPDDTIRSALPARARDDALVVSELFGDDQSDPLVTLDPDAPAFVFFTSGSTGAPKGTLVGHGMAFTALRLFDVLVDDRLALLAPLSFITGAIAAVGIVLTGASGHLFDVTTGDLASLPAWLDERRVTIMGLSVTVIGMIARAAIEEGRTIDSLRFVGHGGEAGTAQHFAEARRAFPNAVFRHGFGQTETGPVAGYEVGSTEETPGRAIPVGYPWPWVEVDIVDDAGQPVARGEAGEIWVTSDQVAFGYWDEPALTAERFLTRTDGRRTVRTGDRGRFRADGMLEHLGRLDRRVKINGQLVDLSQVELELKQLDAVHDAVVSAVPTEDHGYRIVAHVVIDDRMVTVGELRRALTGRLPPYAIPRAFFRVNEVPQTITGKADREWLRESAIGALPLDRPYVEPRTEPERAVARLFEEVLGVDAVGAHDDFFELGGDSLSVMELLAGLADELGTDVSANDLLQDATVESIATRHARGERSRGQAIVRVNDAPGPMFFCVPGAADTPMQYRAFARRLTDVSVYAFTYRGIDRRALPDRTIAAIARRNVAAMREVDPRGPYRLLGYSFGGAVALAMAQLVTEQGSDVELLALLEPSLWDDEYPSVDRVDRLRKRAADEHPGDGLAARAGRLQVYAQAAVGRVRRKVALETTGLVRRRGTDQHDAFFAFHQRMLRAHVPTPYRGPTAVIGSPEYFGQVGRALDALLPTPANGGGRVDVPVAGKHLDLVREPSVGEVTRAIHRLTAELG